MGTSRRKTKKQAITSYPNEQGKILYVDPPAPHTLKQITRQKTRKQEAMAYLPPESTSAPTAICHRSRLGTKELVKTTTSPPPLRSKALSPLTRIVHIRHLAADIFRATQ